MNIQHHYTNSVFVEQHSAPDQFESLLTPGTYTRYYDLQDHVEGERFDFDHSMTWQQVSQLVDQHITSLIPSV